MKFRAILIALCMSTVVGWSQQSLPVRYSFRDGAYLYFASQSISPSTPFEKITSVRVSRDKGNGYRQLVVLARPDNATAFRKLCGEDTWAELKRMKTFSTDAEAWTFIVENPSMDMYGMLAFNMRFRQAMGNGYLDREASGLKGGTQWKYRAELTDGTGNAVATLEGVVTGGATAFDLPAPTTLSSFATDSITSVKWYSISGKAHSGLILADIFRQTGGRGVFQKQPRAVLGNVVGDSVLFNYQDQVQPSTLYRYFVVPHDDLGNRGVPSDTISVLSFDFARLPLLEEVKATDSMNYVFVTWKPLSLVEQLTGIEIQRSRDVRGNYVVVDTVEATARGYRDTQVFPGIPYYYRFRILGLKGLERETGYSGYVNAVVDNNTAFPDPPGGLTAHVEKSGVTLQWQASDSHDLYAYFVYRGVSGENDFEVISPALTSTAFTDTARLSGRVQYAYAVKAVNNNSLQSEFSNVVTVRQPVTTLPIAPGGARAAHVEQHAHISWASTTRLDHAIAGYNIYRREARGEKVFDANVSAASQAGRLGFVLLNRDLITHTEYADYSVNPFTTYEYAVSSVDVFGQESSYSAFADVRIASPPRVISNCAVRKVTGGIELTWDPSLTHEAQSLSVYRKRAGEASYRRIAHWTKIPQLYVDKTVSAGTLYSYRLQAERGTDIVAKSDEKNIRY